MGDYEASTSPYGYPLDEVLTADADPSNRNGTHYFKAHSRLPWDARVVADAQKQLQDENDPYLGIRQWYVEKVERPKPSRTSES